MTSIPREEIERKKILQWINQEKNISLNSITEPGSFQHYDATILSGDNYTKCVVEVKVRDFEHDRYPTAILEEKKIEKLKEFQSKMKQKKNIDTKLIYVAIYEDDYILIWDINNYTNKSSIPCPKTSYGNNQIVYKGVYEYNINNAQKIKLN